MLGSASLFGLLSAVLCTSFSPVPVDALNNGVGKLPGAFIIPLVCTEFRF